MPANINTETIIKRFEDKWGNLYDYSKVNYVDSGTKVIIICQIHREYEQLPSNHLKYGCGKCGKANNSRIKESECARNFVQKAIAVHGKRYTYEKAIYVDSQTKLIVTCDTHSDFLITPNNHLNGKGCKKCGIKRSAESKLIPFKEYLPFFIKTHGNLYDYSQVIWIDADTLIDVICKIHGVFEIHPYRHKTGSGCSKCSAQYSKIAIQWLNYLTDKYGYNIQHAENGGEFTIIGTRYKADGYCNETNTVFEFLGDFWHGNPNLYKEDDINPRNGISFGQLYKRTMDKKNTIINLGYKYVEIWEHDWKLLKNNETESLPANDNSNQEENIVAFSSPLVEILPPKKLVLKILPPPKKLILKILPSSNIV